MAKPKKSFTDYIEATTHAGVGRYAESPVPEFFAQILDISDSFALCLRNFPKKKDGSYTKASYHSHRQISAACLCTIMGHFELYQRFTFAGLVEYSLHLDGFDLRDAVRRLKKDFDVTIDVGHLLCYRHESAAVGQLLVDNLPSWHEPTKVNTYFKAFRPKLNFYSNDQISDLTALWQLRHTMAHTGGWLSIPDAQKVPELSRFRNRALYFAPRFIEAAVRRFHIIVSDCANRLKIAFDTDVSKNFGATDTYTKFFSIISQRSSWL